MGRLIDADCFKKFLQALCEVGAPYEEVIQLLDKEPTAYDVEKVVAELEDLDKKVFRMSPRDAIDIVRKGGIDE